MADHTPGPKPAIPDWIDRTLYPFDSHFLELPAGRMHYVDEGEGPPIVMVHGTPTWSFLYRDLIGELSSEYRVIAPDQIGFGLSDKPEGWSYKPEDHAGNLRALIERLGLRDIALVVHDFGGPIGLSYAIERPENVRALVLFNTWLWSLEGDRATRWASRILGGFIGRVLYNGMNFSPRVLMAAMMEDKSKLTFAVHRHYTDVFPGRKDRQGPWTLARELTASSERYDSLWHRRERIADLPALLLWGMKDRTFGAESLARWESLFTRAETVRFPEAGHFVQEEKAGELAPRVREFLRAGLRR